MTAGISINTPEIGGKQLELLRELTPAATRLAYLTDASNKSSVAVFRQIEAHARTMNVTIRMLNGGQRIELEQSFETIKRERVQGLMVGAGGPPTHSSGIHQGGGGPPARTMTERRAIT